VSKASAEIARLVLWAGRPVKDEDWDGDWRDFDWDHSEAGCAGWQETGQSEVVEVPLGDGSVLFTLAHCRCACRVFPLVTIGLEGTRGPEA
jgi:hypothetical protein